MAAGQKKGRKFGRNRDRKAGRSVMQAKRTERNKRLRIEGILKREGNMTRSIGHVCPKVHNVTIPVERMTMPHLVKDRMRAMRDGEVIAEYRAIPIYAKGYFVDYTYHRV